MQEHQPPTPTSTAGSAATGTPPVKSSKPAKNLYEPYFAPNWFWVLLRAVAHVVFFFALNLKVVGRENIPQTGPFIIASNHLSWVDIPLVPAYMKRPVIYLAKEELFHGRSGRFVRFLGAIPVKRGEADRQLLRASDELLKRGKILAIFPEGTRSKVQQMAQAHAGMGMIALRAGMPVLPVAICGSEHAFKKFRPRVTITYGEPMHLRPKGAKISKDDINDATTDVMQRIASMLPASYRGLYGETPVEPTPALSTQAGE